MKYRQKTHKKSMQNWNIKIISEKSHKNWIWEGLGLDLGVVWDGLELLLDALGSFFAVSLAFKIELFSNMDPRWAPKGLLGRVWEGLGRIWRRFGQGLGRNLGAFERFFGRLWANSGSIWKNVALLGQSF